MGWWQVSLLVAAAFSVAAVAQLQASQVEGGRPLCLAAVAGSCGLDHRPTFEIPCEVRRAGWTLCCRGLGYCRRLGGCGRRVHDMPRNRSRHKSRVRVVDGCGPISCDNASGIRPGLVGGRHPWEGWSVARSSVPCFDGLYVSRIVKSRGT